MSHFSIVLKSQMNKFKNLPESHRNISGQMPCFFPFQLIQQCVHFKGSGMTYLSINLLCQFDCQRKDLTHFCTNQARMFTSQVEFLTMATIVIVA